MSAPVWIGGVVVLALLAIVAGWRLRRAARKVDQILSEEAERTETLSEDADRLGD